MNAPAALPQPVTRDPDPAAHREAAMLHARKRAWQRCGLALGLPELERLAEKARRGKGTRTRDAGLNRAVWELRWNGRTIVVVYDSALDCVVTVLPWAGRFRTAPGYRGRKGKA